MSDVQIFITIVSSFVVFYAVIHFFYRSGYRDGRAIERAIWETTKGITKECIEARNRRPDHR